VAPCDDLIVSLAQMLHFWLKRVNINDLSGWELGEFHQDSKRIDNILKVTHVKKD